MITQAEQTLIQNALNSIDGKSPIDKIAAKAIDSQAIKKAFDAITDDSIFDEIQKDANFNNVMGAVEELRMYYTSSRNIIPENNNPKMKDEEKAAKRAEERDYLKTYLEGRRDYFVKERAKKEKQGSGKLDLSNIDLTKTNALNDMTPEQLQEIQDRIARAVQAKSVLPQPKAPAQVPNPNPAPAAPKAAPAQESASEKARREQAEKTKKFEEDLIKQQREREASLLKPAPKAAPAPAAGIHPVPPVKAAPSPAAGIHPVPPVKAAPAAIRDDEALLMLITDENNLNLLEFVVGHKVPFSPSSEFNAFKEACENLDLNAVQENYEAAFEEALETANEMGDPDFIQGLETFRDNIKAALAPVPPLDVVQQPKRFPSPEPKDKLNDYAITQLVIAHLERQGCGKWQKKTWIHNANKDKSFDIRTGLVSLAGDFTPAHTGPGGTTETAKNFNNKLGLQGNIYPNLRLIPAHLAKTISFDENGEMYVDKHPDLITNQKMLFLEFSPQEFARLANEEKKLLAFEHVAKKPIAAPVSPLQRFSVAEKPLDKLDQSKKEAYDQIKGISELAPKALFVVESYIEKMEELNPQHNDKNMNFLWKCLSAAGHMNITFGFSFGNSKEARTYHTFSALKNIDFSNEFNTLRDHANNNYAPAIAALRLAEIKRFEDLIKRLKATRVVAPNPSPNPAPQAAPANMAQPQPDTVAEVVARLNAFPGNKYGTWQRERNSKLIKMIAGSQLLDNSKPKFAFGLAFDHFTKDFNIPAQDLSVVFSPVVGVPENISMICDESSAKKILAKLAPVQAQPLAAIPAFSPEFTESKRDEKLNKLVQLLNAEPQGRYGQWERIKNSGVITMTKGMAANAGAIGSDAAIQASYNALQKDLALLDNNFSCEFQNRPFRVSIVYNEQRIDNLLDKLSSRQAQQAAPSAIKQIVAAKSPKQPGGFAAGLAPKSPIVPHANPKVVGKQDDHKVKFSAQKVPAGIQITLNIPNDKDRDWVMKSLTNKGIATTLDLEKNDIIIEPSNGMGSNGCYQSKGQNQEIAIAFEHNHDAKEFMALMGLKSSLLSKNSDAWTRAGGKETNVVYFNHEKLHLNKEHTSEIKYKSPALQH